jgi:hypothetical protein
VNQKKPNYREVIRERVAAGEVVPKQTRPGNGGKRLGAGAKKGVRLAPATRERIRGAMLIDRLEKIAEGKVTAEPHQVTAALGLLRFQLPALTATDLTSGGEAITIERATFKARKP